MHCGRVVGHRAFGGTGIHWIGEDRMNARIATIGIWAAAPLLQCRIADAVYPTLRSECPCEVNNDE